MKTIGENITGYREAFKNGTVGARLFETVNKLNQSGWTDGLKVQHLTNEAYDIAVAYMQYIDEKQKREK